MKGGRFTFVILVNRRRRNQFVLYFHWTLYDMSTVIYLYLEENLWKVDVPLYWVYESKI